MIRRSIRRTDSRWYFKSTFSMESHILRFSRVLLCSIVLCLAHPPRVFHISRRNDGCSHPGSTAHRCPETTTHFSPQLFHRAFTRGGESGGVFLIDPFREAIFESICRAYFDKNLTFYIFLVSYCVASYRCLPRTSATSSTRSSAKQCWSSSISLTRRSRNCSR